MQQLQYIIPKNKEIFKYIEELLVTYTFREAQTSYFDKHCKSFENSEENKHFYHDLFKEYTQILDTTIDKKLSEKFSESEIQEFYKDFTEDHKKYDIKSPWVNTVETLFTFTDFENFKQTMIDYYEREHKGKVDEQKPYQKLDIDPTFETFHEYFQKDISEFQVILLGQTEEEISSYTRDHNETVSVILSKYTIKGVEADTLVNSFFKLDLEKVKTAFPYIKILEEIQLDGEPKTDQQQTLYSQIEFPMMPKSESLVRTEKSSFEDYQITRQFTFEHENYPIKEDVKRTQMNKSVYCRQIPGTKNTEVIDITFTEKEFGLPPMFLNMLIAKNTKAALDYFFAELRAQQAAKDTEQQK